MYMKKICITLLAFLLCSHVCVFASMAPPQPNAGMPFPGFDPNMSEEELLNLLMEEINQAIPEDQRENFWQEVARETERLEQETAHMSPEEKEKYLLDMITAEPTPQPETRPESEITRPETTPTERPTVKQPSIVEVDKAQEAIDMLNTLIKSIEDFLNKAAAFPDFDGKVEHWIKQKRITDWPKDATWSQFSFELSSFVHRLQLLKDKDTCIGYKHLQALLEQESLMNNLKQLHARLAQNVPAIDVSVFALTKMTDTTKDAIIKTTNALTEALYTLKLPEQLTTLLATFEPIAKKLQEEEDKATKRAIDQSKRFVPVTPVRVVGKPEPRQDFALPTLDIPGARGGLGPQAPSKRPSGKKGETAAKEDKKRAPARSGGKGATTSGKTPSAGKKKEEDKKKKGTEKDKEKDKDKKDDKKKEVSHPDAKRNITDFGKSIQSAGTAIDEADEVQSLEKVREYLKP